MADMRATEPLPLNHSWPLEDVAARFSAGFAPGTGLAAGEKGQVCEDAMPLPHPLSLSAARLAARSIGVWSCDLATETLSWSVGVYDLFGLPKEERLVRSLIVDLYEPDSRRAMERLRAYAIRHSRGFTLDAQIRRVNGDRRWMRLTAVPLLREGKVVSLTGLKQDVTAAYEVWR